MAGDDDGHWVTLPDGRRVKIKGPRKGGGGVVLALGAAVAIAAGGGAAGIGAWSGAAGDAVAGAASDALAGNTAGDVVDSMPGQPVRARTKAGQDDASKGNAKKAWSRVRFKELKRKVVRKLEREADCLAASSGRVRDFLVRTPCTALERMLLAVGDGHGNAAVVSVVRVGFNSRSQAEKFQEVETVQGSGDIRPLEIAATLGIAGVRMTGLHYRDRIDKKSPGLVVAEADRATGHVDTATLQALADIAVYLPIK